MINSPLTRSQRFTKRFLDLALAIPLLVLTSPAIAAAIAVSACSTRASGIFAQQRIGRWGQPFTIYKIRTMRVVPDVTSTSTSLNDARLTYVGAFLRRYKIDELPQLYNVLRGDMSLVGPRPDVPGFADLLEGSDRRILGVRPGITGPAALAYRNEEALLAAVDRPEEYARHTIWPDKVLINCAYVDHYSVRQDLRLLWQTFCSAVGLGESRHSAMVHRPS